MYKFGAHYLVADRLTAQLHVKVWFDDASALAIAQPSSEVHSWVSESLMMES